MAQEAFIETFEAATARSAPEGLTSTEALRRLDRFGPNAVVETMPPRWRVFLAKFWGPVPWLLEAAIVVQLGRGEYVEAAVVGALLLFNATLGFFQEGRATAAVAALKKRLAPTALVRRDGEWARLAASRLVPGDLIRLPLGALVPADVRLVSGSTTADQSMLTGESVPVDAGPCDLVYAGSLIRRGQAMAEVTATGPRTYFGRAAELVRSAQSVSSEQKAVFGVTRNLAAVNGFIALAVVAYGYGMALPSGDLVRLALTALLATIPVALPATFTLSAAFSAQTLARRGVLLTRLSAVHEGAAMDVLCVDKTGTLTRNRLEVIDVFAMPGFDRKRVLHLAVLASAEADLDPIDNAVRAAAANSADRPAGERLVRFVPFDPATRMSEAVATDADGNDLRIVKGAFDAVAGLTASASEPRRIVDDLSARGHRVIAVAAGRPNALRLAGFIAISDPPREDSPALVGELRDLGVHAVMVTGDSPVTAAAIAHKVGIAGDIAPADQRPSTVIGRFGVFARVVPEEKFRLVRAFQQAGHVVGMCGDGTNDAPALRQAQIGIAVSTATDVAKAAASMVMTEPGLAGIVFAVREGRVAFQRLLTYTLNMVVKKCEIVLFLAVGLLLTGHAVITPALMVLLFITNDFLSMSLTTDRATPSPSPSVWRMPDITAAAVVIGVCKLGFSTAMLTMGAFHLRLGAAELQTLALVTLVFGNQALLYVLRERQHMWSSWPSSWVLASSALDIALVSLFALSGVMMEPLNVHVLAAILMAAVGFALILDWIKGPVLRAFEVGNGSTPRD